MEGGPLVVRMLEDVERFRQGLRSEQSEERYASVRALRMLGANARGTAADVLRLALEETSWRVQVEAAETFAAMGVEIEPYRGMLVEALEITQYEGLMNVSFLLHALGRQAQPLRDDIVRLLQREQDVPAYFLLGCLAQLEPMEESLRLLRGMVETRGRELLFFFVETFGKMGEVVLPMLREGMEGSERITRLVCAAAVWSQAEEADARALLESAQHDAEDIEASCVASCLLVRLGLWGSVSSLFGRLDQITDKGLFSLALSSICNLAHEAPDWVVEKMRGLLLQRDPARLEQVLAACGRLGRLGGALGADLGFLFRQTWDLWVSRRAPVSFRLLLRDRFPLWFPSEPQTPKSAPRQIDPQLFPDTFSSSERRVELRMWSEPLLFRLIDTLDSAGVVDSLRIRQPLGALLLAEDLSWSLRHASAEALGREIHEEDLSPMLRAASRTTDDELASGVLLGLERKLEIAKVLAEIASTSERSARASLCLQSLGTTEVVGEGLRWFQDERLVKACRQKERMVMLEGFLKHRDPEIALVAARVCLLLGESARAGSLYAEWLRDAKKLPYVGEMLRRLIRCAEEGEGAGWKQEAEAVCPDWMDSKNPMVRLLSAVWLRAVGGVERADLFVDGGGVFEENDGALWKAWLTAQGWGVAEVQEHLQVCAGKWEIADLMSVLFAPVWEDVWRERCLFRMAEHLVERHVVRFGAWPRVALDEIIRVRVAWSQGACSCAEMQAAYLQVHALQWDALLLRNQQEHFSTQRVSSLYLLSVVLQAILRPRIGREPSFVIQALLAAQEFYFVHAVGDGLHPEARTKVCEVEARVAFGAWMGEQIAQVWGHFEQTQASLAHWRKEDDALLFSGT